MFELQIYENFYVLDVTDIEDIGNNIYEVEVMRDHALATDDSFKCPIKFKLEIQGDTYKYISVEYENK